jgi:hypothetical protein
LNRTAQRQPWQTAILIALDERTAKECTQILKALLLEVVQAAGVPDAVERIVALQPALVVAAAVMEAKSGEALRERTEAVGAELVWIEKGLDRAQIADRLASAASRATERAERGA